MPSDARHKLSATAATMWAKYDSTVRTGGTGLQRRFAFAQALKADTRLADHDRPKTKEA